MGILPVLEYSRSSHDGEKEISRQVDRDGVGKREVVLWGAKEAGRKVDIMEWKRDKGAGRHEGVGKR